jgi:carbohydrate-selective porin OprB
MARMHPLSVVAKSGARWSCLRAGLAVALLFGGALADAAAQEDEVTRWWRAREMTDNLAGLRDIAWDRGVIMEGRWRAIYFGILASENGSGNAFPQELAFNLWMDLAKFSKLTALEGLAAFGEVRWREPGAAANPNTIVDGDGLFNPSRYSGGVGWRLMSFGLSYERTGFLGREDALVVHAGWIQPQKEFINQPLAHLFANNALGSSEGLGGNIPFGSSFSTWGATIEAAPVDWFYAKSGLFMSYFNPTHSSNHGLMFRGDSQSGNGLFFLGETGVNPVLGPDELPGHYAFGGYIYGEDNPQFGGDKFGFYWQADQMLWREEGEQGLRMFSLYYFAPKYNNDFPFYVQGGLVYEGAIPGRDNDQLMAGAALGQYSYYDLVEARAAGEPEPTQSLIVEVGYSIRLSGWGFVQPFAQYLVQPDGTPAVANAATLGLFFGIDF